MKLHKNGFYRAAGALCGVILEKHFAGVVASHCIKMKSKTPGISDYNENMKDEELNEELKSLCSKWNLYRKEIDKGNKNFCGIRNMTVAHKDHDFVKQYESMKGISWGQTVRDYEKFYRIFPDTNMFITKLLKALDVKFKKEIRAAREK